MRLSVFAVEIQMCPGLGQIFVRKPPIGSPLESRFQWPLPQLVQEKQMMGRLEHTVTPGQDDSGKNDISQLQVCEVFQKYLRSSSLSESVYNTSPGICKSLIYIEHLFVHMC